MTVTTTLTETNETSLMDLLAIVVAREVTQRVKEEDKEADDTDLSNMEL